MQGSPLQGELYMAYAFTALAACVQLFVKCSKTIYKLLLFPFFYYSSTYKQTLVKEHSLLQQAQNRHGTKQIIPVLLKCNDLFKFYFIGVS